MARQMKCTKNVKMYKKRQNGKLFWVIRGVGVGRSININIKIYFMKSWHMLQGYIWSCLVKKFEYLGHFRVPVIVLKFCTGYLKKIWVKDTFVS